MYLKLSIKNSDHTQRILNIKEDNIFFCLNEWLWFRAMSFFFYLNERHNLKKPRFLSQGVVAFPFFLCNDGCHYLDCILHLCLAFLFSPLCIPYPILSWHIFLTTCASFTQFMIFAFSYALLFPIICVFLSVDGLRVRLVNYMPRNPQSVTYL